MESAEQQVPSPNTYMTQELEMLHEGIDFTAFALISSWSLKIDLEKILF